jgi:hypothetical protein
MHSIVSIGVTDIGVGTMGKKKALFMTLVDCMISLDLKHTEASFSPSSIDSLRLRVAEMPRYRDLSIFVRTTDRCQTIALPLAAQARMRGN